MAKRKRPTKKRKTKKQQQQQEQLLTILLGFVFILFAIFGLLKLGFLGTLIANGFRIIGGNTYPILCGLLVGYGGWLMIKNTQISYGQPRRWIGAIVFYMAILLFLHAQLFGKIQNGEPNIISTTWEMLTMDIRSGKIAQNVGGGMIGAMIYSGTYFMVSQAGSYILAVLFGLIGLFLFSMRDIHEVTDTIQLLGEKLHDLFAGDPEKQAAKQEKKEQRKEERQRQREEKKEAARVLAEAEFEEQQKNQVRPLSNGERLANEQKEQGDFEPQQLDLGAIIDGYQESLQPVEDPYDYAESQPVNPPQTNEEVEDTGDLNFEISAETENRDYELPPTTLLDSIPATDQSSEYKKIEKNIGVLEQTFQSFGVDAKVVKASLGPSVTKFEVQPAVGVKVSKIVSLTDDIALALAAKDVRMEAPIPGKSLIGIEVPNSAISMVSFRDIIEAQPKHPDKLLEVPLGRDISGMVQTADLSKMPHLLIAGSTGSGKSVAINGIITSILMQAKPHEVKLMMIDPKMVELNVYNGIPHLLTPVVTNPRKAAQALQKVVQEMEERYEKFAATGVRNISGYNEFVAQKNLEMGENHPTLPFIVVIVDELADLMMVASNEVEDAIIRLAQMARAAGIHMILATQRPSVDVITGIIKANVPSRMAFAVSSGTDSRTIIDSNGAEKLLGRGDMLFLPMGENKPIRVQGAFISDHEVERIVDFVTDQQEARYDEKMMPTEETASASPDNPQDELYEEAKALVIEMQTASVSLLQRRFRVGYNRAARLIDELEAHGVVGASEGSKPRKVLIEQTEESEAEQLPTNE
ncbi:cell division protein FtsK [Enterococcus phoeniculicola]|jgi:S-DNA-T family DNA segregation ATPase FtsK/SpoIIIE|uniref:DNA translocase FtsK n=1 Tax=Enterococcus phoeniculicola ATCC BAA-412 TaxID=1158610 RepID=R3W4F3_9ENTE|nr:DNA translocase FtsK [Enterococcus phoeniculicola]EOL42406.1 cell division protein FtsK [Enterococcus phoeniculicola ATCC BAA-412]EOT79315.1 cell division protein FtsK [Enterococcus phoeniculicola ATCC BAA-412]OJG73145.1 cell division protein FtsK [Enterococcus phoeniculicola]